MVNATNEEQLRILQISAQLHRIKTLLPGDGRRIANLLSFSNPCDHRRLAGSNKKTKEKKTT